MRGGLGAPKPLRALEGCHKLISRVKIAAGPQGCSATSLPSHILPGAGGCPALRGPSGGLCAGGAVCVGNHVRLGSGLYGKRGLRRGAAPIPPGRLGRGSARDRAPKAAAPAGAGCRGEQELPWLPEQMVPRQQSCPFRIDYPGRPFNDRFPGLIKLFSPRAAVPACSPAAPTPKSGGTSPCLELRFASKPNLKIHPGVHRGCASPRGTRSKVSCRVGFCPTFQAAEAARCFPLIAVFFGSDPHRLARRVGSAPTHFSIHNDFGGRRRELGGRRRLRSSTGCRAGRSPGIVRSCCFLHI